MRFTTYSRFVPGAADAVNLQALLDQLGDFLLQSGFQGGDPWYGEDDSQSLDRLREAILKALMESGQLTPEMLKFLRGESSGDPAKDEEIARQLAELLDQLVQRLVEEGYLNLGEAPQGEPSHQPMFGPGGQARGAARQVNFQLTDKGLDFLGYRSLKQLLGSLGRSSFGAHDTPHLATGVEAEAASRPYEFGDTLNLDAAGTLARALARQGLKLPLELEYDDLLVHQADYRSSAATVLMLDCSHSMILYGEDRFTPAKKVALALTHLIRTQYPGDSIRVVLFHDDAEEIPLRALAQAQVGPHHTNTAAGLRLARKILLSQAEGHAADHHDHRRQAVGDAAGQRADLHQLHGARPGDPQGHLPRGGGVPPRGDPDQHLHAGAGPEPGGVRAEGDRDLQGKGLLHQPDDPGPVHPDGFPQAAHPAGRVSCRSPATSLPSAPA